MTTRTITTSLNFLQWQKLYEEEKPFQIFINIPGDAEDQRNTNLVFQNVSLNIHDVRGYSDEFSLDKNGFMYREHTTKMTSFQDRKAVGDNYLPEIEALLKREMEGADRIFFFDWRLRKNAPEVEGSIIDMNDLTTWLRPATHVHVDQSPAAALKRIQLQLPNEADRLLQGRVRIINIWRPLIDSVEDWPLAVCDGSTVDGSDLVETDHVRRQYSGSTMYLMHNPGQKFYYMCKQSKSEVLIFKNFDSRFDVEAKYAPHASFHHPHATINTPPRESIEVRAFVFTFPSEE
ncbi:hypothetical protein MMC07_005984 [Pseudocyphellaria aurata]|nr:hypothetical protein [Pseudocyphellaria aurata]